MPKKRILPYIILGILKQNPDSSGKFITHQFTNEIGEFWKASHSQIYPELKKMVTSEWIVGKQKDNNEKEIFYSLTPIGEEELANWIRQPITELPINHDLFSLKLFFINQKDDPRLSTLINEEKKLLNVQLIHLKEREKLIFSYDEAIQNNYGHYLILKRAISRIEGQLNWLKSIK